VARADQKKKSVSADELEHRKKVTELFEKEISKLEELHSRVGAPAADDPTVAAIEL
jgi:hypothetical protein